MSVLRQHRYSCTFFSVLENNVLLLFLCTGPFHTCRNSNTYFENVRFSTPRADAQMEHGLDPQKSASPPASRSPLTAPVGGAQLWRGQGWPWWAGAGQGRLAGGQRPAAQGPSATGCARWSQYPRCFDYIWTSINFFAWVKENSNDN